MQVVVVVVLFVAFLKKTSDCKFNIVNWIKGQSLMINAVSIHLKIISEVRIVLFIPYFCSDSVCGLQIESQQRFSGIRHDEPKWKIYKCLSM